MKVLLMIALCIQLYGEVTTTQVIHTTRVETREDKSEVVSLYTSEVIQNDTQRIAVPEEEPFEFDGKWWLVAMLIPLAFI